MTEDDQDLKRPSRQSRAMIEEDLEQALLAAEDAREEADRLARELVQMKMLMVRKIQELEFARQGIDQREHDYQALVRQVAVNAQETQTISGVMAEELQILVEELTASNDELIHANEELVRANADLEKRVAERTSEIRENERLLSMAQRYAGAGTWEWRIDTDRVTWSEGYFEVYGLDPGDTKPSRARWLQAMDPADRDRANRTLRHCVDHGSTDFHLLYRITHPSKGLRWVECRAQATRDGHGRAIGLTGLIQDVTERRLAEEAVQRAHDEAVTARGIAEKANREKSRFLASVSHDLRQPVTSANLFLDMLRRRPLMSAERALVEPLASSLESLTGMLNGLLEVARLDAGIVRVEPRDFQLDDLLRRLHDEFLTPARVAGLRLDMPPVTLMVRSDPLLVELVLRNLISNAIKYTLTGGVIVMARARDGRVLLDVADTGQGIAATELARIFDDYYQVGDTAWGLGNAGGHSRGFGIGLATAKRISTLLETRIDVVSEVGRGSTFSLSLPLSDDGDIPVAASRSAIGGAFTGCSALVVDDEPLVLQAVELVLDSWGMRVHTARTLGQVEALLAGLDSPPDIVVADYTLGHGERGTDVVAAARRHGTTFAVLLTGDTSPERLAEAERSGCRLLHKPIMADMLEEMIRDLRRPA